MSRQYHVRSSSYVLRCSCWHGRPVDTRLIRKLYRGAQAERRNLAIVPERPGMYFEFQVQYPIAEAHTYAESPHEAI